MIAPTQSCSDPAPARPGHIIDDLSRCQDAAASRRNYLRNLTTGRIPLTAQMHGALAAHIARLAVITNEIFGGCEQIDYAWWLGLELEQGLAQRIDDFTLEQMMHEAIAALPDPHCALLAAIAADCEFGLERPEAWQPGRLRPTGIDSESGPGTGAWLDLVGGPLGYSWSTWEARRLARAASPAVVLSEPTSSGWFA